MGRLVEVITQTEFDKRFAEYMKDKVCEDKEPARWYMKQLMKFDKELHNEGITVRAGFYVENNVRIDE